MKTVILVRHAKSSWDDIGQSDIERPLNDRGKKDAPEMAERLSKKEIKIDQFISSPAKRAKRTARYFAEEFGLDKKDIQLIEKLYGAEANGFYEVINDLDDELKAVALFSHNPGITDFVNSLSTVRVDNMPTCAMFAVAADIDKWTEFKTAEKKFLFFDYPKNPQP